MTTAAFVLGIIGAVTGAASLGWTVAAWFLAGGRIVVELDIGFYNPLTGMWMTQSPAGPDVTARQMKRTSEGASGAALGTAAIIVTVTNVGRTALTVHAVHVVSVGGKRMRFGTTAGLDAGDRVPKRLEPGEHGRFVMVSSFIRDMATIALNERKGKPARFVAEACAGVAKPKASKRVLVVNQVLLDAIAEIEQRHT